MVGGNVCVQLCLCVYVYSVYARGNQIKVRHLLIKPTAGKLENLFSLISSHISEGIFSVSCAQNAFTFVKTRLAFVVLLHKCI